MKVVFFSSYYPKYLDSFYKKNPLLGSMSYDEQLDALHKDFFGDWASYLPPFYKLGAEPHLIVPNCKPLQEAWAKENNIKWDSKTWQYSLPIEQVKMIKPDVFYIGNMFEYYGEFLDAIKKYTKKIFGWIACEIPAGVKPMQLDLVLSSLPLFVDQFRKDGLNAEFLTAAFDSSILNEIERTPADINFSFIGSLTKAHSKRINMIKHLIDHTDLEFYGLNIEAIPDERPFFKRLTPSIYKTKFRGEAWGLDMYKVLNRSKITFNAHIDISGSYIGNMRMYEATGMGTLLLTDGKNAPVKLFTDDEVVYYDTVEDAIDKYKYYISHETERNEIARKGQRRTLSDYSYEKTSAQLYDYFAKYIGQ
ncbi:MAG TPA: glycosyltransferase [Chitinophagaceae bacterium]|nr:glycosyltransferase [Chitinophagaceae bacterium]